MPVDMQFIRIKCEVCGEPIQFGAKLDQDIYGHPCMTMIIGPCKACAKIAREITRAAKDGREEDDG